ncbi:uncharacterized protein EI90DRAFT_3070824 [Cantharellus anzutake]|uniref:uncharacterized protein n=1 Tax=Cantharellus anzutake TaxID=1750568 RepID=UPI001908DE95|nr:uncharacterized protein EI90DRAFT_3070824 [Cantharellus anzutake]KAF8326404.1 hypothetical protein EI90DRAFT_3070824 [Cantharellus anzutake]
MVIVSFFAILPFLVEFAFFRTAGFSRYLTSYDHDRHACMATSLLLIPFIWLLIYLPISCILFCLRLPL